MSKRRDGWLLVQRGTWVLTMLLTALAWERLAGEARAQESAQESAAQDAEGKEAASAQEPKAKPKFRGRLPAYYKNVVSETQRKKIYGIQQEFAEKIHALQTQIMELVKQRDTAVQGVLTDKQRERILQLIADAKAKRAAAKQPLKEEAPGGEQVE